MIKTIVMGIMMLALTGVALATERYDRVLDDMVSGPIAVVVRQKALVSAVARQNQETADFSREQIEALDARWRAEVEAEEQPFIDALLERELSQYLMRVQKNSDGWITEIMIMDAKGLNVAQSQATSDYWQGDEAKWQVPFDEGRIHIGDIELDDSTQSVQTQISVPIKDRFSKIIGAATFGISFHP